MANADQSYQRCIIKSFKHDGSLHRMWLENWQVPEGRLYPQHASESMWVFLNDQTTIVEADGKQWVSRIPAVSFFMQDQWFNVVALLEDKGIRYYCNLASPPYRYADVLTYIDYDLDVVLLPNGTVLELDRDEFLRHKDTYRYSEAVQAQVEAGLATLQDTIARQSSPFGDDAIRSYYEQWKQQLSREGERQHP
ncbi:hypothetical protein SD71_01860 [Cohnella kolymensis]|uniref:DUF402 domain-containing protein n=1 Tax=Cohnella kolymensis TaxID=1590652 RepID=A0ABR5A8P6_9BACL|nr:DUF402 domain-containing protein [Cohnella kolymensis]KIL37426.1 hypothetical protein SD71_01860 [Cohnella kolymensis]